MLVAIRPGVSFRLNAALSFARIEKRLGRKIITNRTTVDEGSQQKLYDEWLAGMHPEIPVVLDPKYSVHVYRENDEHSGVAFDADERNNLFDEYGWKIVNRDEMWHREYFPEHDQHINEKVDSIIMKTIEVLSCPAWEASNQRVITNGNACMTVPAGWAQMLIDNGAEFTEFAKNEDMLFAVNVIWTLGGLDQAETNQKIQQLIDLAKVKI